MSTSRVRFSIVKDAAGSLRANTEHEPRHAYSAHPAVTFINLEKYRRPFCARYAISAEMYICVPMSESGHSRRFDAQPATSGLPQ